MDRFRFERLKAEHDVEIVLVPFELRPSLPLSGVSAVAQGLRHSDNVEAYMVRLARTGGFRMEVPDLVPNTHLALAMSEAARDVGPAMHERIHAAIFEAYFADGRDIGREDVLLDIAEEQGMDVNDVAEAWLTARHDPRLHAFFHLGLQFGITSTPSALICNELLIGSRPYRVLADALERCLVTADNIGDTVEREAASAPPAR